MMFEYTINCLRVYGFKKIVYLDENKMNFKYKRKELIIQGRNLRAINLLDKSLDVKGVVENIAIRYLGVVDD